MLLEIRDLKYKFGKRNVLSNLNFNLEEGNFYALMGANGSGKTTLLRCLSGMLEVEKNKVFINNQDIGSFSAKKLAKLISIVPQRQEIPFDFTAFEIVMMGRNPYQKRLQAESDEDYAIVEDCMRKTNTWNYRNSYMNKLSGGEFQRVTIARAMAQQTPIMLLDEPLSNLDIAHQYEILELLTALKNSKNITIVLILHDLNMALKYSNKLLLLKNGEIAFLGNTTDGLLSEQMINNVFDINASFIQTPNSSDFILLSKK